MEPKQPSAGTEDLRTAIARNIEQLAAEVGRKAVAGEVPAAEIERLNALQAALQALPPQPSHFALWASAVGLLCLIAASVAWTVHVPRTRVQFDLFTDSATLRLVHDVRWDGNWASAAKAFRLQHVTHLDLPPEYGPRAASPGHDDALDVAVADGNVRLRHLGIGSGGALTVSRGDDGAIDISVAGGPFTGDIDVTGDISATLGSGTALPAQSFPVGQPPARFGFQYDGRSPVPALLRYRARDRLALQEIEVEGVGFFEEQDTGTGLVAFASQIQHGTLTMTDTGEQLMLGSGAALRLGEARGVVSTMEVGDYGVHLRFEGTAGTAVLGSGDFARELKPSALEWLYHQQKIGFLWGAVTFLWGIAWSGRKLLSGGG